tara:strand:+ start:148 stop:459 length:312 start_codon:yes stop_codon:yes gene_type:complete
MKLLKFKQRVKDLITKMPHLRDDDMKLIASVWYYECKEIGTPPSNMNGHDLLNMVADGQLANPSSIRRCRAKLQELNPELRGQRWLDRQTTQQADTLTELNYI